MAVDKLHRQDVVLDLECDVPIGRSRTVVQSGVLPCFVAGTTIHSRSGIESTKWNVIPEEVVTDAHSLFSIDSSLETYQ